MKLNKYLDIAGITDTAQREMIQLCMNLADERSKGLLWFKIKARFFKAGKIAKALKWESNRLIEVRPDWADYDIAPITKITCNGDNGPWEGPIGSDRPVESFWMNPDPESVEYQVALHSKYAKGKYHPRSEAFRKMWYRRNSGEYLAYRRGLIVDASKGVQTFAGTKGRTTVKLWHSDNAWLILISIRIIGKYRINIRRGFEVANIFSGTTSPQAWFPIPGYDLMAPVTWSTLPSKQL